MENFVSKLTVWQSATIVILAELAYAGFSQLILDGRSWKAFDVEVLRTVLRCMVACVLWVIARPLILSRKPTIEAMKSRRFTFAVLLFLSIPVLAGNYQFPFPESVLFALTSVPVAIHEEFLFRGIIQNVVGKWLGNSFAILLASIMFSVWHLTAWDFEAAHFVEIFLCGIFSGIIYVYTGSILVVISIHAIYDALLAFSPWGAQADFAGLVVLAVPLSFALIFSWARGRSKVNFREVL